MGFISQNKFCSCFLLWMKLMRGFLFILELSAGFLGFLDAFAGDFLGSSGNSMFRALSARSDVSSISAEKLKLFGSTERGERGTWSKE